MAYPFFCLISPLPLFLGLGLRLGPEGPPLFLDQKEARRAETIFFLGLLAPTSTPPPPLFPLSEGLDPSLICYRSRAMFYVTLLPWKLR